MPRLEASDGRKLFYLDEGQGPVVLCLAGLTRNRRDFDAVAARLTDRFRVLRLDSRGRGGSERALDPAAEYDLMVETGDALHLLDTLGIARAAVIGTSRGGLLAGLMASLRPGLLGAVAVNDIGPRVEMAGLRRIAGYVGGGPAATFQTAAEGFRSANEDRFPGIPLSRWLTHAHATYDDDGGRPVFAYDPALAEVTRAGVEGQAGDHIDASAAFAGLAATPLLVIRGARSDILSADTAQAMVAGRDDAAVVEVADRGHAPFLDEPEVVAALDPFLDRYAAP
ncbi:MAG: alpha/beta hydrolase [Pseudomonadota bacterium]